MATKAGFGGARAATGSRSAMRIIKKYPNRRLYDTATSGYITLADVKQMVVENTPFQVRDAKTNEELTRAILLQIILEEEAAGVPMFSGLGFRLLCWAVFTALTIAFLMVYAARIKADSLGIKTEDFENQKIDADRLYARVTWRLVPW